MAYNVSSTTNNYLETPIIDKKLSTYSQGMQSTFGAEVRESCSGSFVKIVTTSKF